MAKRRDAVSSKRRVALRRQWRTRRGGGTTGRTLEGWPGVESPGYFVSGVNPRQGGNVVHVARPPAAHESSTTAVAESEKIKKEKARVHGYYRSTGKRAWTAGKGGRRVGQTDRVAATVATSPERDQAKINGKKKRGYQSKAGRDTCQPDSLASPAFLPAGRAWQHRPHTLNTAPSHTTTIK